FDAAVVGAGAQGVLAWRVRGGGARVGGVAAAVASAVAQGTLAWRLGGGGPLAGRFAAAVASAVAQGSLAWRLGGGGCLAGRFAAAVASAVAQGTLAWRLGGGGPLAGRFAAAERVSEFAGDRQGTGVAHAGGADERQLTMPAAAREGRGDARDGFIKQQFEIVTGTGFVARGGR